MGNSRENETVSGSANDIYARQGGYGPGPEARDKPIAEKDVKESISRQESSATIVTAEDIEEKEK